MVISIKMEMEKRRAFNSLQILYLVPKAAWRRVAVTPPGRPTRRPGDATAYMTLEGPGCCHCRYDCGEEGKRKRKEKQRMHWTVAVVQGSPSSASPASPASPATLASPASPARLSLLFDVSLRSLAWASVAIVWLL